MRIKKLAKFSFLTLFLLLSKLGFSGSFDFIYNYSNMPAAFAQINNVGSTAPLDKNFFQSLLNWDRRMMVAAGSSIGEFFGTSIVTDATNGGDNSWGGSWIITKAGLYRIRATKGAGVNDYNKLLITSYTAGGEETSTFDNYDNSKVYSIDILQDGSINIVLSTISN